VPCKLTFELAEDGKPTYDQLHTRPACETKPLSNLTDVHRRQP
jgi:hypothetical protein